MASLFYAQGCVWKIAAMQHTPRAASREKTFPTRSHGHPEEKCQQELTVKHIIYFSHSWLCAKKQRRNGDKYGEMDGCRQEGRF